MYTIVEKGGLVFTSRNSEEVAKIRLPSATETLAAYNSYFSKATKNFEKSCSEGLFIQSEFERLKEHSDLFRGVSLRTRSVILHRAPLLTLAVA